MLFMICLMLALFTFVVAISSVVLSYVGDETLGPLKPHTFAAGPLLEVTSSLANLMFVDPTQ